MHRVLSLSRLCFCQEELDQVVLEVPSNLAFRGSAAFALGRCGLAMQYITAMCGELSTSQKASQKFRLTQEWLWMVPPCCCSQDHAPSHPNKSCLKMAEEINTYWKSQSSSQIPHRKHRQNPSSEFPSPHTDEVCTPKPDGWRNSLGGFRRQPRFGIGILHSNLNGFLHSLSSIYPRQHLQGWGYPHCWANSTQLIYLEGLCSAWFHTPSSDTMFSSSKIHCYTFR